MITLEVARAHVRELHRQADRARPDRPRRAGMRARWARRTGR